MYKPVNDRLLHLWLRVEGDLDIYSIDYPRMIGRSPELLNFNRSICNEHLVLSIHWLLLPLVVLFGYQSWLSCQEDFILLLLLLLLLWRTLFYQKPSPPHFQYKYSQFDELLYIEIIKCFSIKQPPVITFFISITMFFGIKNILKNIHI